MTPKTPAVVTGDISSFTIPIQIMDEISAADCVYASVYCQNASAVIVTVRETQRALMSCYVFELGRQEMYNVYGALLCADGTVRASPTIQGKVLRKYEIVFANTYEAIEGVRKVLRELSAHVLSKM